MMPLGEGRAGVGVGFVQLAHECREGEFGEEIFHFVMGVAEDANGHVCLAVIIWIIRVKEDIGMVRVNDNVGMSNDNVGMSIKDQKCPISISGVIFPSPCFFCLESISINELTCLKMSHIIKLIKKMIYIRALYPSNPIAYPIGITSSPYPSEADIARFAVVEAVS